MKFIGTSPYPILVLWTFQTRFFIYFENRILKIDFHDIANASRSVSLESLWHVQLYGSNYNRCYITDGTFDVRARKKITDFYGTRRTGASTSVSFTRIFAYYPIKRGTNKPNWNVTPLVPRWRWRVCFIKKKNCCFGKETFPGVISILPTNPVTTSETGDELNVTDLRFDVKTILSKMGRESVASLKCTHLTGPVPQRSSVLSPHLSRAAHAQYPTVRPEIHKGNVYFPFCWHTRAVIIQYKQ